jgi:hypothetical protein
MNCGCFSFGQQAATIAACLLLLDGCQTAYEPGGSPGVMASIRVNASDTDAALTAVEQVFHNAGFKLVRVQPYVRIFERPGSKMDSFKYGDWDGNSVLMRAKVSAELLGKAAVLDCRVVAVREYGQPVESENPVWREYRKEYQTLMDQVQQRLVLR